ncbi:uncharacterized protein BDV14DRAFT_170351 [Aspergillus stella-maris]|uniref:uncharacterized protein n=1 Tax=Aspergillus stella-maris TaxID=1810926 RepID=UPI003CCDC320
MPPQTSALSQTLGSLTQSKIRELEKQRSSYEDRKAKILSHADAQSDLSLRVKVILDGTKAIYPSAANDMMIEKIEQWLDQRRFDPSVTDDMLREYEDELRSRLDAHSRKMSLADLYSRLLTEWADSGDDEARDGDGSVADGDEEYMVVEERQKQRLQQLCDQFEATVFTPLETSAEDINAFLDGLFSNDDQVNELKELRKRIGQQSLNMFEEEAPFDHESLAVTIKGLLTEDLLSEEKKDVLKGFLKNKVALAEIADVLNMRWADLENWDWFARDEGIPVLPRQQLNGKYRIWMDEDVLQLIFVQYIGTRLCNLLKTQLKYFIEVDTNWNWKAAPPMTEDEKERRLYYLGKNDDGDGPEKNRKSDYLQKYFLTQLPISMTTLANGGAPYDDEEEEHDEDSEEDGWGRASDPLPKDVDRNIKQQLLRKVATETLIQRNIYDAAAIIQSDLRWYGTGLPHSTIFTIMSYIGLSKEWIAFFHKYLESPLNMDASSEGRTPAGPRTRKRGVPMAHSSEKFVGELILFFMDLAVNRTTGLLLYRLHDDLWVSGEPSKCAEAWEVMNSFVKVAGLEFNLSKTGSVYLAETFDPSVKARLPKGPVTFGFLKLDASGTWVIDQTQVEAHVQQLKTQLEKCDSIMAWIRTWNSCIGRFFKNTFGQPATCFGQQHVDMILETYRSMQGALFRSTTGTVTEHLRQMIQSRFGVSEVPDALFYYPEELGGLGLRNPSISPFLIRGNLEPSPLKHIEDFFEKEKWLYKDDKRRFDELSQKSRTTRFAQVNNAEERRFVSRAERDTFMSFDEWSKFRWSNSHTLQSLYRKLQNVPKPDHVDFTVPVFTALYEAISRREGNAMDTERRYIVQMYAPEVLKKYGGVSLVDKKYLPIGVMAMIKERRVKWQMVL